LSAFCDAQKKVAGTGPGLMSTPKNYPLADHDAYARSVSADAYWKQVRRTVNGEPVSEAQIELIVRAIQDGLSLGPDDTVLDIACGNGALSSRLFHKCRGLVGVDMSPYLIEIAKKDFAREPNYHFQLDDALTYLERAQNPSIFTKAGVYGAFQYFSRDEASRILRNLHDRLLSVTKVFVGNLPDKSKIGQFYRDHTPTAAELNDHAARLGVWYEPEEFRTLAESSGWRAICSRMPPEFHAAHYRFDVTLERGA
jgi:SAM-dependent methyltransferase